MKVSDGAERSASHQAKRLLLRIALSQGEAVGGEGILGSRRVRSLYRDVGCHSDNIVCVCWGLLIRESAIEVVRWKAA